MADLTVAMPGTATADPLPLLRQLRAGGASVLDGLLAQAPRVATLAELEACQLLLPPVPCPEVWAAGVTYARSRDARDRESRGEAAELQTPYDRVYAAERPELFFKATGYRVQAPGRPVGLRGDSRWQVPEPELALVLDGDGAILGYTLGNDVSSRDIEGENPLYLPQAKIFRWSCAIGPAVLPFADAPPDGFPIQCRVVRGDQEVWRDATHTRQMRRSFAELVHFLGRYNWIPAGSVLLTGTGIVPPDDFTLLPGDWIEITSPAIGTLRHMTVAL